MKILVPVKRVVDKDIKIRVKSDGSGVELANVKMSMNPFDEIAVEEAIRLKEAGKATEIVCVSIGAAQAAETIRTGLAMGADRGILVKTDAAVEPLAIAKILKAIVDQEKPGPRADGQAGDRRRQQPDRTDAGRLAELAAGHVRVQGRDRRFGFLRDARSRRRPADRQAERPGGRHHRFAAERAALCESAEHHESEEEADRREDAGGLRRRRQAAAASGQDRRAGRAAKPASRSNR